LLFCMYISVSGISYHQMQQQAIGSLTIDPAFLCGTICRRDEKIKTTKERAENLRIVIVT
jgi:hypothetical protein